MPNIATALFRTVDGVFAVDSGQRVTFWSPACSQLLGIPAEEAIGQQCCEVLKGKDPFGNPFCRKECAVSRLGQGKRAPKMFPLWTIDPDGEILKLSVSIILVPSHQTDRWTCVHLLHRDPYMDMLDAIDPSAQAKRLEAGKARGPSTEPLSPLTPRENEVITLLAEGHSTSTISRLLDIRRVTVRNHIQHIEEKLGVHSKMEAVAYAYRHHLL